MYNCVICVCICVIVGFVLLVSVGFKTSGRCLLKGGKYVTRVIIEENQFPLAGSQLSFSGITVGQNYAALESRRSFKRISIVSKVTKVIFTGTMKHFINIYN